MAQRVLWIQLEDKKRPYKHIVTDVNQDLDDLATEICEKKLKNIDPDFMVITTKPKMKMKVITLTHSTGTWHELLAQTRNKFKKLKEGDEVYFVDQETKKLIIEDKVTFDRLLSKTEADEKNRIFIDLIVRIKGKKPYGDWSLNEVLDEILHKRYPSLLAMPELDIGTIVLFSFPL
ncbi:hypothetical protein BC938DRAFT_479464 [Jimgerdemannia flammicorona]|uniref:Uncharacterized protein n=1 Tax=Jimgerdemannia flammicorona TaxID=994334 RepID=A0A433QKT8_9FUNG|nr:hypothetical protein BC938DRAFT_479464 [Jimgerdemannia flammicorona]